MIRGGASTRGLDVSRRNFHICPREAWEAARDRDGYRPEAFDREGFVHASRASQVVRVANAWSPGREDLVLLAIDRARPAAWVRLEGAPGASPEALSPHVEGPIDRAAVVTVLPSPCGPDGLFPLSGASSAPMPPGPPPTPADNS